MKLTIVIVMVILLVSFSYSCSAVQGTSNVTDRITIDNAVDIAAKEAIKRKYPIAEMNLQIIINYIPTFMYFPYTKSYTTGYTSKLEDILTGKQFWSIYYRPKGATEEKGDICVFVDKQTGEIITVFEGDKL